MKIKSIIVAAVSAVLLSSAAQASITIFTDRSAWELAVGGSFFTETFDSSTPTGFTLEQIGTDHSTGINGGVYNDRTVLDTDYTNYNFNAMIYAFGANWDLEPGGAGQGLQLYIGNEKLSEEIPNTFNGGFFGIVSTNAFNLVSVHSGTVDALAETHTVDNVVFGAVSAVPEPESYALMLAGLGLMGTIARRRKAKQV